MSEVNTEIGKKIGVHYLRCVGQPATLFDLTVAQMASTELSYESYSSGSARFHEQVISKT